MNLTFNKNTINTNKSLCIYPFIHSHLTPRYDRKLCCISKNIEGANKSLLEDYWNSNTMKNIRKSIIAGDKIAECKKCYQFENAGIKSLREVSWLEHNLEEAFKNYDYETGEMYDIPVYYDYRTLHCNLQCVTCNTDYSSTWIKLAKKLYKKEKSFDFDFKFEDACADEVIKAIDEMKLTKIYWAGGEPMMSVMHWKIVEKLIEVTKDPRYETYLRKLCNGTNICYNTNLTRLYWKGSSIPKLLKPLQPTIYASIDGVEETYEYCRDGANWNNTVLNWNEYIKELNNENQMNINSVMNSLFLFDVKRFVDFFSSYKVQFMPQSYSSDGKTFMDIRFFPKNIMEKVCHNAIVQLSKLNQVLKNNAETIINSLLIEKETKSHIFNNIQSIKNAKFHTLKRDNGLISKRSYGDCLKLCNTEAYDFYMSIESEYWYE